jgi:autotransporter translocation and assembly factor TamB
MTSDERPDRSAEREAEQQEAQDTAPGADTASEADTTPETKRPGVTRRALLGLRRVLAVTLGVLSLSSAGILFFITQTPLGRNTAARLISGALEGALNAEVRLGPIVGGNLITRAIIERFEIRGPDGEIFVALDSARLEYNPAGFLSENFTFRSLDAARMTIRLHQYPDGSWNFERILGSDEPPGEGDPTEGKIPEPDADRLAAGEPAAEGQIEPDTIYLRYPEVPPGLRLLFHDARVDVGSFEVRRPYAEGLTGAALRQEVESAMRGERVWVVEPALLSGNDVPGPDEAPRYEQVIRLDSLHAEFPLLRISHPAQPMRFEIQELTAVARAVVQPLEVRGFQGTLNFADTINVDIERLELPASRLRGTGQLVPGSPLEYRFDLVADPAGFADLQWLPIPLPADGGGPLDVVLRSAGETMVVEVEGDDIRSGDSRFAGSFAVALEDPARFQRMEFRIDPLRVRLINDLLDRPELIDGYLRGSISGSGRIDNLNIDADLILVDLDADDEAAEPAIALSGIEPSALRALGGVSITEPYTLSELELTLGSFEPRWTGVLGFDIGLSGRTTGTMTLSGVPGGLLTFDADVDHIEPGSTLSHISGRGTWDLAETSVVDVSLMVDPLSLALVDPYFPEADLRGEIRGPIDASGGLADLEIQARLQTPRGQLSLDGRFDLASDEERYDAELIARGIDLAEWLDGAPQTTLDIQGRVDGTGFDPATLSARLDLQVLPSVFRDARIDTSHIRFSVADGLATVDTFVVDSDVGILRGRGSFGLASDQSGALVLVASAPDLATWNRWLVEQIPGSEEMEQAEDLFAGFGLPEAGTPGEADEPEGLDGSLTARGVLFGNSEEFSFGGQLDARGLRYNSDTADSLTARLDIADPTALDSLVLNMTAWNVQALGQRADSLRTRLVRQDPGRAGLWFFADRDTAMELTTHAALEWGESGYAAAVETLDLQAGDHVLHLSRPAYLAYGDSGLVVRDLDLRGTSAVLRADGQVLANGSGRLEASLDGLLIDEFLEAFPTPPDIGGQLSATLEIDGSIGDPTMQLSVEILDPRVSSKRHSALLGDLAYRDGSTSGTVRLLEGQKELVRIAGAVAGDMALRSVEDRVPEEAFDFRILADSLPAGLNELWLGGLEDLEGYIRGDVGVRGGPDQLRLSGLVELVDGSGWIPDLGIALSGVTGAAEFSGSQARVHGMQLTAKGTASDKTEGRGQLNGMIDLAQLTDPAFDVEFETDMLRAMDRRAMSFLITGAGRLTGSYRSPRLTGSFRVRDGDIRQDEFLRSRQVIDLTDLLEQAQNPFMQNLQLEASLDLGPNLWLRSDVLDVELVGQDIQVSMDRSAGLLTMVGEISLPRGNYTFDVLRPYHTNLRITEGTITFVGTPDLNPNVNITAEYRTRTREGPVWVWAHITGTMRQTQLTTSSNPPTMTESDRLCFIAVGAPCFGSSDTRLGESLVQQSVLGTLSSGLSSALVGSSGLSFINLRSTGTAGYGERSVGAERSLFERTEIEVGWYAGEELFFSVAQPLGGGVPRIVVEWRFSENWILEARAQSRFDSQQFGLYRGTNLDTEQTYGIFLFREWAFP